MRVLLDEHTDAATMSDVVALYQRWFPLLLAKCRRVVGDDAEAQDLAQETFIRLWKSGPAQQDDRAISAWLYSTATRLAFDHLRRQRRRARLRMVHAPAIRPACDPQADRALEAAQEWRALALTLPAEAFEVGVLTRVDGLTQAEVAEVLGKTPRTVRRILQTLDVALRRHTETP